MNRQIRDCKVVDAIAERDRNACFFHEFALGFRLGFSGNATLASTSAAGRLPQYWL